MVARADKWPDAPWREAIPAAVMELTCPRLDLIAAVERAGMFSTSEKPNINLVVGTEEGGIRVSSADIAASDGSASTLVDATGDRAPMVVSMSWRYLRDALRAVEAERATIALAGEFLPVVVRPAGQDGHLYLIAAMTKH